MTGSRKIRFSSPIKKRLDKPYPMDYTSNMTPKELKAWRRKNEYSQSHLARVLGVIPLTVSRWERGVREIPSFLHLALRCLELEGGEVKGLRGMKTKKKKEVKR